MAARLTTTSDPTTTGPLLTAVGLGRRYGAVQALADVDLRIDPGELIAVVGDNGAGKSTFVKILAGAVQPSSGRIEIEGSPVELSSPTASRDAGIETVYQDLGLCENLTVAENVFLGREPTKGRGPLRRIDHRRMTREVRSVLATLSINVPAPDAAVSALSGGQRQAVALSRCRLWRRRLVLLDEPTAALGVQESERVVQTIRDLRRDGAAIVLVSHDIPMVMALADRIVVLRKGRKAADVPTGEIGEHEVVSLITGAANHPSGQAEALEPTPSIALGGESTAGPSTPDTGRHS
ncbi:ATP-binding cassette domain-containing protein [Actinoalloteichus hymeniacidonis]|uniref:ABC transporter n=1 Tax=Actinoalloteichus hymeniacidonis TaxID=340345 RepID=A0AAC9MYZ2_9PSEU|nr:ATP-binding cassette domain-containing protein [Actinoalloteichus hymeniacidonis]AOS63391.1 ABC transporter [Actinoalloteichus hymeniacidonis]MBB5908568.1 ABC-type sugar transport system ATPase subunit [Actinoalloteichus hymeniacidonis]